MSLENKYPGWRFLYSPRWLGYYAMLLIFALCCVLLANWQFARQHEAKAEIARVTNNYAAPAQPLAQVLPQAADFNLDKHKWLRVTARGKYVTAPALVRNRPGDGGNGSVLVQGFLTADGQLIFVERGWVAYVVNQQGKAQLAQLPAAAQNQDTRVVLRLRAAEPTISGSASTRDSAGSINPQDLAKIRKTPADSRLLTSAYGMLVSEDPQQAHGKLPKKPQPDEGPHLSYALQWLVFIIIAATGIGWAAKQEFKNFNRGSARVASMEAKKAARLAKRKAKRGLSDAEIEDALLD